MGKGDRRSKRGKIFRGTYGKRRPKPQEERKKAKAAAAAATRSRSTERHAWSPRRMPAIGSTFAVARSSV